MKYSRADTHWTLQVCCNRHIDSYRTGAKWDAILRVHSRATVGFVRCDLPATVVSRAEKQRRREVSQLLQNTKRQCRLVTSGEALNETKARHFGHPATTVENGHALSIAFFASIYRPLKPRTRKATLRVLFRCFTGNRERRLWCTIFFLIVRALGFEL